MLNLAHWHGFNILSFSLKVWTAVANLINTSASPRASGQITSALATDGTQLAETFDGSVWSAAPDMGTSRPGHGLVGNSPADNFFAFGGHASGATLSSTERFNGTTWASAGTMPAGRYDTPCCGRGSVVFDRAIAFSGWYQSFDSHSQKNDTYLYYLNVWSTSSAASESGSGSACGYDYQAVLAVFSASINCYEFNTSVWSTGNASITESSLKSLAGTQTDAVMWSTESITEEYDGTTWRLGGFGAEGGAGFGASSAAGMTKNGHNYEYA